MKDIYSNIPKRNIIIDFTSAILWSLFQVVYVRILSLLVTYFGEKNIPLTIVIFYFGIIFLWEVIEYISDVWQESTSSLIESNTRVFYLNKLYSIKPTVIKEFNTGYINGVVNKYIRHKSDIYHEVTLFVPLALVYIVYAIYTMSSFHIVFGVALFLIIVVSLLFMIFFNAEKESGIATKAESVRDKSTIDSISNISTIQKMRARKFILTKLQKDCDECSKTVRSWAYKNEITFCGFKLCNYLYLPIVCYILYLYPNIIDNKIELFGFLSVICIQLTHTSKSIANAVIKYSKFKASTEKINEIFSEDNKRHPFIEEEFRNAQIFGVEYKYADIERNTTTTVKIPFFQLNKGDKVCIYGESGQGKTTLLNILSGEIETEGVIINGQETHNRLECVFISQDTEILDMSLRDNLTLGSNVSDYEIVELINRVGLEDWYKKQKDGLDTRLGERGVFVSTGQRQRLNLIRGLLKKDKEVYLLDEPTSNVDEQTELKMIDIIQDYLKDKTVVIVTHRPTIKKICNKGYKFTDSILGSVENYDK